MCSWLPCFPALLPLALPIPLPPPLCVAPLRRRPGGPPPSPGLRPSCPSRPLPAPPSFPSPLSFGPPSLAPALCLPLRAWFARPPPFGCRPLLWCSPLPRPSPPPFFVFAPSLAPRRFFPFFLLLSGSPPALACASACFLRCFVPCSVPAAGGPVSSPPVFLLVVPPPLPSSPPCPPPRPPLSSPPRSSPSCPSLSSFPFFPFVPAPFPPSLLFPLPPLLRPLFPLSRSRRFVPSPLGLPSFFPWFPPPPRARIKCIDRPDPSQCIDVLLIDMNGIIHNSAQEVYGYGSFSFPPENACDPKVYSLVCRQLARMVIPIPPKA